MALKIVFFNIQNFGITRSGDPDILQEVCRTISAENAHIVCIQELQVSSFNDAAGIVAKINNGLSINAYNFILCPHNGFEMYLYLYRGSASLEAAVLDENGPEYANDTTLPQQTYTLTRGSTSTGNGTSGLADFFPLFDYTDRRKGRAPGAGLFRYVDANNAVHWLTIFNWHNDACNQLYLEGNIDRLGDSDLIDDGEFDANVGGTTVHFDKFIVGGDFNSNMNSNRNRSGFRSYTCEISDRTHLHVFDKDKDSTYTSRILIRDRSFDNALTWFPQNTLTVSNQAVIDPPEYYMVNKTGQTKTVLENSDLITQVKDLKFAIKSLNTKFSENKKKKKVSKSTMNSFNGILKQTNLKTTTSNDMETKIKGLKVPVTQERILIEVSKSFLEKQLVTNNRWNQRLQNMNGLLYNDTLFLTRKWISDHLPVTITLNP